MHSKFVEKKIDYTGEQLRSNWIKDNFALEKDAIVAFIGAADVKEHMVDLEDIANEEHIFSEKMLHFIAEHQDNDLEKAVCRQRLMISIIKDWINKIGEPFDFAQGTRYSWAPSGVEVLYRKGDDLFVEDRKLSVSIATKSPNSTLIHTGLNISSKNTPVKAIGLEDLKIDPEMLALRVMESYTREIEDIYKATRKVKQVK